MTELLMAIDHANTIGYAVKIKNEYGQRRITCIYELDNTSASSIIPHDHFTSHTVSEVIKHNIEQHKERNQKS